MADGLINFTSHSKALSGIQNPWTSHASGFDTTMDIPKEFAGNGAGFSPEDLYALALQNCFIATFKVIADKSRLDFSEINVSLNLILDKDVNQLTIMKDAFFEIKLIGVSNNDKALRLLEKTTKSCMILNSVNTQLHFNFEVQNL